MAAAAAAVTNRMPRRHLLLPSLGNRPPPSLSLCLLLRRLLRLCCFCLLVQTLRKAKKKKHCYGACVFSWLLLQAIVPVVVAFLAAHSVFLSHKFAKKWYTMHSSCFPSPRCFLSTEHTCVYNSSPDYCVIFGFIKASLLFFIMPLNVHTLTDCEINTVIIKFPIHTRVSIASTSWIDWFLNMRNFYSYYHNIIQIIKKRN